jgi:hypothetical protein
MTINGIIKEKSRSCENVRLYLNRIEERSTKPLEVAMAHKRIATPVDWLFAPEWLTVQQACELSGWDLESMQEIIDVDGVDLNHAGLIHKQSLLEFQETLAEVLHWDDD